MARVIECRDKTPWEWIEGEDYETNDARHERAFEAMMAESDRVDLAGNLVGLVVRFGVADGYAYYRVAKTVPLVLEHIPFGDAYFIDWRMLKGFDKADIVELAEQYRGLVATFAEQDRQRAGRIRRA